MFVDLDRDAIRGGKKLIPPVFPSQLRKRLLRTLRKCAIVPTAKPKPLAEHCQLFPYGEFIPSTNSISCIKTFESPMASVESIDAVPLSALKMFSNALNSAATIEQPANVLKGSPSSASSTGFMKKIRSFTFGNALPSPDSPIPEIKVYFLRKHLF